MMMQWQRLTFRSIAVLLLELSIFTVSIVTVVSNDEGGSSLTTDPVWGEVDNFLKDFPANAQLKHGHVAAEVKTFMDDVEKIQQENMRLIEETFEIEKLIQKINVGYLEKFSRQLNETLKLERSRRSAVDSSGSNIADFDPTVYNVEDIVHRSQLGDTFDSDDLLRESDEALESWLMDLIRAEIEDQVQEQHVLVEKAFPQQHSQQQSKAPHLSGSCETPVDAAHAVQEELTKNILQDQIGLFDHLSAGATIVYSETSDTFVPEPEESQKMANVWWRRYIPQDWERLLPEGWEEWNGGIPHYVYHTLGWRTSTSLPASPEQILFANTNPGSCWPMAGRHGQVTIRLPYPVEVDAITIDHVSSLLISPDGSRDSAPKNIRIMGYPPCEANECNGMGFDMSDGIELKSVEYDLDGKTIQTFSLLENQQHLEEEEEGTPSMEDEEIGGSCSTETASCSAPPMDLNLNEAPTAEVVSGISLQILDNWGNEDFTCVYRVRVHGEAIL